MRPSSHALPCRPRPAGRKSRTRGGFSLIELLVVIGILAVLLSILVPTITIARKQGRSTQCLSNLRQIGQGFRTYASNFDGAFPVAVHDNVPTAYLPLGPGVLERRWYDLIAPYVAENRIVSNNYDDIRRMRINSVVWGCPEYAKTQDIIKDPNSTDPLIADERRPGYGMNYKPASSSTGTGGSASYAYITESIRGSYVRMEKWTKPSERGLVADGPFHTMEWSTSGFSRTSKWAPYDQGTSIDLWVDARHTLYSRSLADKPKTYDEPCIGMLFVDGHASLVSVKHAYNSFRNPGEDTAAQ